MQAGCQRGIGLLSCQRQQPAGSRKRHGQLRTWRAWWHSNLTCQIAFACLSTQPSLPFFWSNCEMAVPCRCCPAVQLC